MLTRDEAMADPHAKLSTYTTTRVQVTVEVTGSVYGPEWNLADLAKQTGGETVQYLRTRLQEKGCRIIGEPKVIAIMASDKP